MRRNPAPCSLVVNPPRPSPIAFTYEMKRWIGHEKWISRESLTRWFIVAPRPTCEIPAQSLRMAGKATRHGSNHESYVVIPKRISNRSGYDQFFRLVIPTIHIYNKYNDDKLYLSRRFKLVMIGIILYLRNEKKRNDRIKKKIKISRGWSFFEKRVTRFFQGESRMKPLVTHPPRPILRSKNNENHRNKNKIYRWIYIPSIPIDHSSIAHLLSFRLTTTRLLSLFFSFFFFGLTK